MRDALMKITPHPLILIGENYQIILKYCFANDWRKIAFSYDKSFFQPSL